jgi:hypothetical protein
MGDELDSQSTGVIVGALVGLVLFMLCFWNQLSDITSVEYVSSILVYIVFGASIGSLIGCLVAKLTNKSINNVGVVSAIIVAGLIIVLFIASAMSSDSLQSGLLIPFKPIMSFSLSLGMR